LARRLGCGAHDADDLVQQSLVALAAARDGRPAEVGLRAWLGRRISLDARTLRRSRSRRARHEATASAPVATATALAEVESKDAVDAALDRLDPDERQAIVLRFLHDLEYRELAYVLGTSTVAARLRVHRAVKKLRARLGRNATALIATSALWTGAKPAEALMGGVFFVSKTVKLSLLAALLAVALLIGLHEDGGQADRAETVAGATSTEPDLPQQPENSNAPAEDGRSDPPPADDAADESQASDVEWKTYEGMRAASALSKRSRDLTKRMSALFPKEPDATPQADATSRLFLEELIAKFHTLSDATERRKLLEQIALAHVRYVNRTQDTSFLPFFERVIRDGGDMERAVAAGGLTGLPQPQVVDVLLRAARHDDAQVRAAAIQALAQVEGGEADRAHRIVIRALEDESPDVRWPAAMSIEFVIGGAQHVTPLLDAIGEEHHPVAMHAMVRAVLALDPDRGHQRIQDVLASAPAEVKANGKRALARKEPTNSFGPPKLPTVAKTTPKKSEPQPDDTTRRYLVRLADEFAAMPQGPGREEHLRTFAQSHARYLRRTSDASLLPKIDQLIREKASKDERRTLVQSVARSYIGGVIDQLIKWATSEHPEVRAAAAWSLAYVTGPRETEARAVVVNALDDPEASVRRQVALFVRQFGHESATEPLLRRLASEEDFTVVYAIVGAVLALDKDGAARIEKVAAETSARTRSLIERSMKAQRG
jgi:RNA polymerase sigma-70 factor (ECF subfamily)